MKNLPLIPLKLSALILLLVGMNLLYERTGYEKDIQTYSDVINKVRKVVENKCEIIYIGESSNIGYRTDDLDKRPISAFIADACPGPKLGDITKEASHAGIYYELLRNIPPSSSVKTIIVTMNLRSFDANWIYSELETPLQRSMVLIKHHPPLLARFLLSFKGYDTKSNWEREKQFKEKWKNDILHFPFPFPYTNVIDWDHAMANQGVINPDGSKNYPLTELACHYIKTYAFQIDTNTNPRIKDFDNIVKLAESRHWNLIFNLLAENTEKAQELVGDEVVYLMRYNRDLLVNRYRRGNVLVVDNLESVHDDQYIDQNWTTEHYAETGRKTIAKNVARMLQEFYPCERVGSGH
jgi:hypothetical protein